MLRSKKIRIPETVLNRLRGGVQRDSIANRERKVEAHGGLVVGQAKQRDPSNRMLISNPTLSCGNALFTSISVV